MLILQISLNLLPSIRMANLPCKGGCNGFARINGLISKTRSIRFTSVFTALGRFLNELLKKG